MAIVAFTVVLGNHVSCRYCLREFLSSTVITDIIPYFQANNLKVVDGFSENLGSMP